MKQNVRMVISDLDGTLLPSGGTISKKDLETFKKLGEKGIWRVIATGRNIYSLSRVVTYPLPIDYLVFSTGLGILKWPERELLVKEKIGKSQTHEIFAILMKMGVDFMMQFPVPENHFFYYHKNSNHNPDFDTRVKFYREFCQPFPRKLLSEASQFIVIEPENLEVFEAIKSDISGVKVVRTTSPLDGKSLWIEIFPEGVSKGHGIEWLCNKLSVNQDETLSVGNDYNDLDLLHWTKHSFVVDNAPDELKQQFDVCHCHTRDGFTSAVLPFISSDHS